MSGGADEDHAPAPPPPPRGVVVCDASVAVAWLLPEPETPVARRLAAGREALIAPELLLLEVGNVLLTRLRRGATTPVPDALLRDGLPEIRRGVALTPDADLAEAALALGARLLHPIYDCLYLALARREEAALATFDRRLAARAREAGVPLWSPQDAAAAT